MSGSSGQTNGSGSGQNPMEDESKKARRKKSDPATNIPKQVTRKNSDSTTSIPMKNDRKKPGSSTSILRRVSRRISDSSTLPMTDELIMIESDPTYNIPSKDNRKNSDSTTSIPMKDGQKKSDLPTNNPKKISRKISDAAKSIPSKDDRKTSDSTSTNRKKDSWKIPDETTGPRSDTRRISDFSNYDRKSSFVPVPEFQFDGTEPDLEKDLMKRLGFVIPLPPNYGNSHVVLNNKMAEILEGELEYATKPLGSLSQAKIVPINPKGIRIRMDEPLYQKVRPSYHPVGESPRGSFELDRSLTPDERTLLSFLFRVDHLYWERCKEFPFFPSIIHEKRNSDRKHVVMSKRDEVCFYVKETMSERRKRFIYDIFLTDGTLIMTINGTQKMPGYEGRAAVEMEDSFILGTIVQNKYNCDYTLRNTNGTPVFRFVGACWATFTPFVFWCFDEKINITMPDGVSEKGYISKKWSGPAYRKANGKFGIKFNSHLRLHEKALILSCATLIYFQFYRKGGNGLLILPMFIGIFLVLVGLYFIYSSISAAL